MLHLIIISRSQIKLCSYIPADWLSNTTFSYKWIHALDLTRPSVNKIMSVAIRVFSIPLQVWISVSQTILTKVASQTELNEWNAFFIGPNKFLMWKRSVLITVESFYWLAQPIIPPWFCCRTSSASLPQSYANGCYRRAEINIYKHWTEIPSAAS